MPRDTQLITFISNEGSLDQEQIQQRAETSRKAKERFSWRKRKLVMVSKPATVKVMDIRWLVNDKMNFFDLTPFLQIKELDKLFQADFMRALTHQYWGKYQFKVIFAFQCPWLAYSILCLIYFAEVLNQDNSASRHSPSWDAAAVIILILAIYLIFIEIRQISGSGLKYFKSWHEYNDWFQYVSTLWIIMSILLDSNVPDWVGKRTLCVFILLSQGLRAIFQLFESFDSTTFYVALIAETITDVRSFGIIMLLFLIYSGAAMYMLQLNAELTEDGTIIQPVFEHFIVDSTLNQYLLMLGEFQIDGFESNINRNICYIIFILSTIFSNITLLNMLIALMGDTFDRVQEKRSMLEIKSKISQLANMRRIYPVKYARD